MSAPQDQKTPYLPLVDPRLQLLPDRRAPRRNPVCDVLFGGLRVLAIVLTWFFYLGWISEKTSGGANPDYAVLGSPPRLGVPENIQKLWGQYSPWFPVDEYVSPPPECTITQVNILQRHGARFPNKGQGADYRKSVERLLAARRFMDARFHFLDDYEYALGAEDLVPFGASQSFEAGSAAYERYAHLVNSGNIPFVRAADAPRVVMTAANWTVGFAAASHQQYNPAVDVLLSEKVNNTLNNHCPNAGKGRAQLAQWRSVFAPPIAARLHAAAPGIALEPEDVFHLMAMCPFETVATGRASPFCALFTEDDFRAFEHHGDLEKYYRTGYGEPLGAVQGVGYVNELLARLTESPVQDHTQTNASLPFPLGRTLYADFSHEHTMVAVYSALGLFDVAGHGPSPRKMPAPMKDGAADTEWVASRMVPFSARMVTERMDCAGRDDRGDGVFVRILVNDALQSLEFCGAGDDGLCTLDEFVESQGYARRSGDGDFAKCYN